MCDVGLNYSTSPKFRWLWLPDWKLKVNRPSWPVFLFKSSIQGHLGKASKAFSTLDFSFGVHGVGQAMKDVADRWEVLKWQPEGFNWPRSQPF